MIDSLLMPTGTISSVDIVASFRANQRVSGDKTTPQRKDLGLSTSGQGFSSRHRHPLALNGIMFHIIDQIASASDDYDDY